METKLNGPYTTDSVQKEEKEENKWYPKDTNFQKKLLGCVEHSSS
jgi:hypothetical protein